MTRRTCRTTICIDNVDPTVVLISEYIKFTVVKIEAFAKKTDPAGPVARPEPCPPS